MLVNLLSQCRKTCGHEKDKLLKFTLAIKMENKRRSEPIIQEFLRSSVVPNKVTVDTVSWYE